CGIGRSPSPPPMFSTPLHQGACRQPNAGALDANSLNIGRLDGPIGDRGQDGMTRKPSSPIAPPILTGKEFAAPSVFEPANLLREARRQKSIPDAQIPEICVLDPDGDILRVLRREGRASLSSAWACYHTDLYEFVDKQERLGIIGCAVGASFAVLL